MGLDAKRVVLKRDGSVLVDGADTGWKWMKTGGWHPQYVLRNGPKEVSHYRLKTFKLKVLDYHNGCGEFA